MKKFPFIECPRVFKRLHEPIDEIEQEPNENEEKIKVSFGDQLVMIGTAFIVIVIPCVLVLLALSLLSMWIFGLI